MRKLPSNSLRIATALAAGLVAFLGLLGFQISGQSLANYPLSATNAAVAPHHISAHHVDAKTGAWTKQAPCGDTAGFQQVNLSSLPKEATDTVNRIKSGGPFPYPQDGQTFTNREGVLPDCAEGYYKEYTVVTPGSPNRGARRFVVGEHGEYFYTGDHYASFQLTNINA